MTREEAYKAWTGEEMGKTGDEINEMNKEIIKDILKIMPTAYLLEALGVDTFEELTEQADRPTMTEEVRDALMRLTMCAREECDMCKHKDECGFEFQCNISTENMNTLLEALSADAVQGWIPLSHDYGLRTDFPYERDGEWVVYESKTTIPPIYKCSNCQKRNDEMSNYCPNCGAYMGGNEDVE